MLLHTTEIRHLQSLHLMLMLLLSHFKTREAKWLRTAVSSMCEAVTLACDVLREFGGDIDGKDSNNTNTRDNVNATIGVTV